jgi:hypothetical protein
MISRYSSSILIKSQVRIHGIRSVIRSGVPLNVALNADKAFNVGFAGAD